MGLFDTIREKAAELLSGVTDKVGDLPGAEILEGLSGSASDAVGQATDGAEGAVQDLGASATEAATDATGAVSDATDSVTGSVTDATDTVTGSIPDMPDAPGEPPQP
jgi:uncharacterized protein YjbJ (UPF0337 family)